MNMRAYKSCFTRMEGFFTWKIILYICYEVWSHFHGKVNKYKIICHSSHGSILKSAVLHSLYLNSRSSCIANLPSWDESMRNGSEKKVKQVHRRYWWWQNKDSSSFEPKSKVTGEDWSLVLTYSPLCHLAPWPIWDNKMTYLYAIVQARWIVY